MTTVQRVYDFDKRPLVYVAGPYVRPDCVENTHKAIKVGHELQESGLVTTHVPHVTLLSHIVVPLPEDHWYAYDIALLARCDALYRMAGASTGADREVEYAIEHGIPVFALAGELFNWAEDWLFGKAYDDA